MDFAKRCLLAKAFFYSQFNYWQLVWMCHNRTNNNNMNRLHERYLRLIYNDKKSSFKDRLEKDGSVSIHHINLRTFAVELFKVFKSLGPVIFAEVFPVRLQSQYNMRNYSYFAMPRARTVKHVIKTWKPDLCSCKRCKVYLQNIGYLQSAFIPVCLTLYISFPCLVICWN